MELYKKEKLTVKHNFKVRRNSTIADFLRSIGEILNRLEGLPQQKHLSLVPPEKEKFKNNKMMDLEKDRSAEQLNRL